jgi:tRNA(Ile)-lysidine synthase
VAPRALPRPPAVARVLERVTAAVREHAMVEPGRTVLAAVSGGADSLCLLHTLVRLRRLLRIQVVCFHFDHRLRAGSERDATYVRGQARRLGVPFVLRRATSRPARGESVEAWARTARYRALFEVAEETTAVAAAVGHTADDQAETVLMALLRGGGLEALAGMEPVSPPVIRPLLGVSRAETEAFCRSLRLRPRSDPANRDRSHLRVAIRLAILPLLSEEAGRDVRPAIVRTAALLRQDARLLERLAGEAARDVVVKGPPPEGSGSEGHGSGSEGSGSGGSGSGPTRRLRAGPLAELPRPLAGRVVREVLLDLGTLPEARHVSAVLNLAGNRVGARATLPGGLLARRETGYVALSRPSPGRHDAAAAARPHPRSRKEGRASDAGR